MVLIYAISGIVMNHRNTINPNYSVERQEYTITEVMPPQAGMEKDDVLKLLAPLGEEKIRFGRCRFRSRTQEVLSRLCGQPHDADRWEQLRPAVPDSAPYRGAAEANRG